MDINTNIETHESIKQLTCNWKIIGNISAFIHRNMISKLSWTDNIQIVDNKPVSIHFSGDPTIINIVQPDVYNINVHNYLYQSLDVDIKYLHSIGQHPQPKTLSESLMTGLITVNAHLSDFITQGYEYIYDQKIKKIIDYLFGQRNYYLDINISKN